MYRISSIGYHTKWPILDTGCRYGSSHHSKDLFTLYKFYVTLVSMQYAIVLSDVDYCLDSEPVDSQINTLQS